MPFLGKGKRNILFFSLTTESLKINVCMKHLLLTSYVPELGLALKSYSD